jgi:cobalamin biosynthesis Mg chelatase CobN
MHKFILLLTLLAAIAVSGLALATSALAGSSQVLSDCNRNGHLTGHYSRSDLQSALNGMGADVMEYSGCYDAIHRALLVAAAGGGKNSGGGGSSTGTHGVKGAVLRHAGNRSGVSTRGVYSSPSHADGAGSGSSTPVSLGGSAISPTSAGIGASSGDRSLPAPLIAVLVVLALGALSGGGFAIRRRVLTHRGS